MIYLILAVLAAYLIWVWYNKYYATYPNLYGGNCVSQLSDAGNSVNGCGLFSQPYGGIVDSDGFIRNGNGGSYCPSDTNIRNDPEVGDYRIGRNNAVPNSQCGGNIRIGDISSTYDVYNQNQNDLGLGPTINVGVENSEEELAACNKRKQMLPKDDCKLGNGLDILSYLGLGPADQDQLNLINHKDHNNLAWILRRPLNKPRKLINNLKESTTGPATGPYAADNLGPVSFKSWNPCKCDIGIVNLDRGPAELEGVTTVVAKRLVDDKTHNILFNLSPDFMRTGLKQYYGEDYYNDIRYPERPLSIEFAVNPADYCLRHPQEYPCALIASRKDIR